MARGYRQLTSESGEKHPLGRGCTSEWKRGDFEI